MLIKIYEKNPSEKELNRVVASLEEGGVCIYPTDTIYALGCDFSQPKAIQRLGKIKGVKPEKANFSIICSSISQLANYVKLDNQTFKLLKRNLPGPFTFILPVASHAFKNVNVKRKSIGVRIPDSPIILQIVERLGRPIVTTSIRDEDEVIEYTTDPELIHEKYEHLVDLIVDGGYGNNIASTIVDCTQGEVEIIRQGVEELKD